MTVTQSFSNLYRHPRQEKYHSSVSKARWLPSLGTDLRLPFYHLRLPQPGWRLNVFNSQWGPRLSLKYKSAEIHHVKYLKSGLEYKKHFPPSFRDFAGEEPCQQDYLVPGTGGSWSREGKYPESTCKGVVDLCSYRAGKTIILELYFNNIPSQKDSQTLNRLAANQQSKQKVAQTLTDNGQTVFNPAWQLRSYLGVILCFSKQKSINFKADILRRYPTEWLLEHPLWNFYFVSVNHDRPSSQLPFIREKKTTLACIIICLVFHDYVKMKKSEYEGFSLGFCLPLKQNLLNPLFFLLELITFLSLQLKRLID